MSDFTISTDRVKGRAQAASVTCDLTAFGGEVVSATGPAESLTVSSGKAKVPQGKEITCQVDLNGVVGRNRVKAALTTGGQTFSRDYVKDQPVVEVETHPTDLLVEAAPTGTYEVEVGYTVTFTNNHRRRRIRFRYRPAPPGPRRLHAQERDGYWYPLVGRPGQLCPPG